MMKFALLLAAALGTAAQQDAPRPEGENIATSGSGSADEGERRQTDRLNGDQQRQTEAWLAREAQRRREHEARLAAFQAESAAHARAVAEAAQARAQHEAAMEAWRRRVQACQSGDHSQCAQ